MNPEINDSVTLESKMPLDRKFNAPEDEVVVTKSGKIVSVVGNTVKVIYDRKYTTEPDPMPEIAYELKNLESLGNGRWKISHVANGVQTIEHMAK